MCLDVGPVAVEGQCGRDLASGGRAFVGSHGNVGLLDAVADELGHHEVDETVRKDELVVVDRR